MPTLPPSFSLLPYILLFLAILHIPSTLSLTIFDKSAPCVQLGVCSYLDGSTWIGGVVPVRSEDVMIDYTSPITLTLQGQGTIFDRYDAKSITIKGNVTFMISNALLFTTEMHWNDTYTSVVVANNASLNSAYSTGSSLIISGNSVVGVSKLKVDSVHVIDSVFTGHIFEGSIQATGFKTKITFTSLRAQNYTLMDAIGELNAKSVILSFGTLNLNNIGHVAFDELILGDNAIFEYTPPNEMYDYVMDIGQILAQAIPVQQRPKLILHDNSRFFFGTLSGATDFVLGDHVVLTVTGFKLVDFWGIQQAPKSYAIIAALLGILTFHENVTFQGPIMQGTSGVVNVKNSLAITPFVGKRCVMGGELNVLPGGTFTCYGTIEKNLVIVHRRGALVAHSVTADVLKLEGAHITSSNVTAVAISATPPNSTINSDVIVRGDGGIQITDKTLFINGSFLQVGGTISPTLFEKAFEPPFLLVAGQITLKNVKLVLPHSVFSRGNLVIIKSLEKTIFCDPYPLETIDEDASVHFSVSIQNGEIVFTRAVLQVYQVLVAVSVTLIAIFLLLTYYYRIWKNNHNLPISNEHELEPLET